MIPAALEAVALLFSWPVIAFVIIGAVIGVVFGALPGLGGAIGIALLIPITFGMGPESALGLFAAVLGGVAFGGSVSAILVNVPGTGPNAATCFDGYPMARNGQADVALGISATASALGAVFGLIVLLALLPIAREFILMFGMAEFFWLAILGLTLISVASRGSVTKSLVAGFLGLLLSTVGYAGLDGSYRYGFGTTYLWDGIELIPALIGLFAIGEVMKMIDQGGTISKEELVSGGSVRGTLKGMKEVVSRPLVFFRSCMIGVLVGLVPGAGGSVANFISYGIAQQSSKTPDKFGSGIPEGIIASEAANDAKDGGALLPTVVFGIPGSAGMAVLLGAFTLHGVSPGTRLLQDDLGLLLLIVFSLLIANIITSIIGLTFASRLALLTRIPVGTLIPWILVISLVGAFAYRNLFHDVTLAVVFGFLGYAFVKYSYSRVAFLLGLILGPIAENALIMGRNIGGYELFFISTISQILILLTVGSILLSIVREYRKWNNND